MKLFLIIYGSVSLVMGIVLTKATVYELKQHFKPQFYEDKIPGMFFKYFFIWPWYFIQAILTSIFK